MRYKVLNGFTTNANPVQADSAPATVNITVTPVNDPPGTSGAVVADDSYTTPEDTTLTVIAPGVLANDGDVDGDALTAIVISNPARNTTRLSTNDYLISKPVLYFNETDSF